MSDTTVTGAACMCASDAAADDCAADQYCWTDNTCNSAPRFRPCALRGATFTSLQSDTHATGAPCQCAAGETTDECAADQYCWTDNTCNPAPRFTPCASLSDTAVTGSDCKCA